VIKGISKSVKSVFRLPVACPEGIATRPVNVFDEHHAHYASSTSNVLALHLVYAPALPAMSAQDI